MLYFSDRTRAHISQVAEPLPYTRTYFLHQPNLIIVAIIFPRSLRCIGVAILSLLRACVRACVRECVYVHANDEH